MIERIPIEIVFREFKCNGELVRIFSPRTIESLIKIMPLTSNIFIQEGFVYFKVPLEGSFEKPRLNAQEGDIMYWPAGRAICLFFANCKLSYQMNLIGKILSGLENLRKLERGGWIRVSIKDG
ncbi:MAG: cyclophilin-like fold protein [Candidatus Methanomethyliaceae archaeon]|nr:cyclophilin-like fold protein [Candidatus Methanomethyliaceae archaeon]